VAVVQPVAEGATGRAGSDGRWAVTGKGRARLRVRKGGVQCSGGGWAGGVAAAGRGAGGGGGSGERREEGRETSMGPFRLVRFSLQVFIFQT